MRWEECVGRVIFIRAGGDDKVIDSGDTRQQVLHRITAIIVPEGTRLDEVRQDRNDADRIDPLRINLLAHGLPTNDPLNNLC